MIKYASTETHHLSPIVCKKLTRFFTKLLPFSSHTGASKVDVGRIVVALVLAGTVQEPRIGMDKPGSHPEGPMDWCLFFVVVV